MGCDPTAYRRESRARWAAVARGWASAGEEQAAMMPVAAWMLDAARLQPGHQVLELAAGPGEVGFLAWELIQPGGGLICSDFVPEMVTAAQERAAARGLDGIRFKQIDAESIDLPAASQDAVLCRCGYMLMADPGAALRETRRVLRPGGRLSLATWATAEENPWSSLVGRELVRRGLAEPPEPGRPGQFTWSDAEVIEDRLGEAGFVDDIRIEPIDLEFRHPSAEAWLQSAERLSSITRAALDRLDAQERVGLLNELAAAAGPWTQADGALALPGRALGAAASA